ncbi:hypothetical protein F2Q68_00027752 [Brassica cretica]|uniref:Uncharacterized protein n=1 Tax=Brassica cretica TaxID=69181 RepID=A0A8S9ICY2_BRACR|nr:hypothetical protein F2Q68_00027752 [Brassica cretica]
MLLRNPPSMFSDWVDLHSSLLLACYVFGLQKHQEVYIKLYSGLKPQSARVLWQDPQEFAIKYRESELVTGEDDAYRYTYIMGLRKTLQGQRFAMPLLRIALQSPAGAARGQLVQL